MLNPEAQSKAEGLPRRAGDLSEADVERLLSEQFAATLDAQRGRAAAHFAKYASDRPAEIGRMRRGIALQPLAGWWRAIGSATAAAVAAAIGIAIFIPQRGAGPTPPAGAPVHALPNPTVQTVSAAPVELGVNVSYRDAGMILMDAHTPVQRLYRHRVDSVRWSDPADHATIEMDSPHDEIVLAAMQKQ